MVVPIFDDLIKDEQRVSILFMIDGVLIIDYAGTLAVFYNNSSANHAQTVTAAQHFWPIFSTACLSILNIDSLSRYHYERV
ncbi:hypothetical protein CIK80_07535 [Psychrobacter sp. JB193]|nr:hypothetical protein CIK80_07535 [Psychrobacter sp. JB193]